MNEFESKLWIEWIGGRPEAIQQAAKDYPPGMYKLFANGEYLPADYMLIGYTEQEDGSVTAILETEGVLGMFPRQVFGVRLEELTPINILKTDEGA
jgi:hypothetical protein